MFSFFNTLLNVSRLELRLFFSPEMNIQRYWRTWRKKTKNKLLYIKRLRIWNWVGLSHFLELYVYFNVDKSQGVFKCFSNLLNESLLTTVNYDVIVPESSIVQKGGMIKRSNFRSSKAWSVCRSKIAFFRRSKLLSGDQKYFRLSISWKIC
jgi:hypothetical protein